MTHRCRGRPPLPREEYERESGGRGEQRDERGEAIFVVARGQTKAGPDMAPRADEVILALFGWATYSGESRSSTTATVATVMTTVPRSYCVERTAFQQASTLEAPLRLCRFWPSISRRLRRADEVIGNLALLDVYAGGVRRSERWRGAKGERTPGGVLVRGGIVGFTARGTHARHDTRDGLRVRRDFSAARYLRQSGRNLNPAQTIPHRDRAPGGEAVARI